MPRRFAFARSATLCVFILLSLLTEAFPEYVGGKIGQTPPSDFPPGNVRFGIDDAAIAPVVPLILKTLKSFIGSVTVPEQRLHGVSLETMQVQDINIGNMSLHMNSTNRVDVSVWNMTANVPETNFSYNLVFVSCSGTAKTDVRNANVSFAMRLSIGVGGILDVSVEDMAIQLLDLVITPSLNGWCKSMDFVVGTLMNIFKRSIADYLQQYVPAMVQPIVRAKTVDILQKLPISFVSPPNITDGRMEVTLAIHSEIPINRTTKAGMFTEIGGPLPERDISMICSFAAANNVLRLLHLFGNQSLLNMAIPIPGIYNSSLVESIYPDVVELCPNCPLKFVTGWTAAPWLEPVSDKAFITNAEGPTLSMDMVMDDNTSVTVLGAHLNATANVTHLSTDNSGRVTIKLASVNAAVALYAPLGRKINSTSLNTDVQVLLNEIVVPFVNAQTGGFALPFDVTDLLLKVSNAAISVGLNAMEAYPLIGSCIDRIW
ncbi:expression site-associated gene (ESAG) protein,putative [Trypanosoma brucei gambiense DAL972]|uniref:Expression site-associated gene (ESAG) protein,putative n=1 Tax=Trypanosoma brucei gambiense (strain MHOM/CI/86/DAL972) TaxID=679716 RepID=C9ZNB1_TRYB9|nr:expression site-associated gene (ESAG) protein,putative [Trypanosoma brucei gambiense DAL972]CBH10889.1 expression site-associated gene (ESAG) protein,putative [Trypanosoma brucei gambiense DAL972]|eukprot:XP_011773176.1 expression site-associated gene (ESAG) protein,putative [Trypanosoma brucei gambiense DAL972]